MTEIPREVLVFGRPGTYQFRPSDYPWLSHARVIARGADGTRDDGSPGESGYMFIELYGKTDRP